MKNIVLIFTDQLRADAIHALGNADIQTPMLDALTRDSLVFNKCYTPSPVCVPARLSMMLGQYPARTGCNDNQQKPYRGQTLYARLTRSGYKTCGIGKMHFPLDAYGLHGFAQRRTQEEFAAPEDDYFRFLQQKQVPDAYDYNGQRSEMYYIPQNSRLPQELHPTQWIGDESVEFLQNCDGSQPFFLMSSFIHPHPPFCPPVPWNKLYRQPLQAFVPESSPRLLTLHNAMQNQYKGLSVGLDSHLISLLRQFYYACVSFVDYQVGRIIETLKEKGLYDDTLIVFSSDHGELLGDYNALGKRTMLDAACRVPLLLKCGKAGSTNLPASLVDLAPTLLSFAGVPYDPADFDGIDLLQQNPGRELVYSQFSGGTTGLYMVCGSKDKLIYSRADEKYWYFTAFPESENLYSPENPRCVFLQQALAAYQSADCSPQNTRDPEKIREDLQAFPYRAFRQDHKYCAQQERGRMPDGYQIQL